MDSKSLEKRLSSVKDSSEDIQALSRWCIQHKNHHHSIVQAWSRAVRKAKVGHRLTLFYVCNDIVQNARRKKCTDLVQFFGTAVKEAAPLVRDDKIKRKITRIFKIWEDRGIYDAKLIAFMTDTIENVGTVNATESDPAISSFQLTKLEEGIRNILALEDSSRGMLADLKLQENCLSDEEICKLQTTVKERGSVGDKLDEFEDSVVGLEVYITALHKEIEERTRLVTLLEEAEIFYETQRGEAKLVANAYKNFSSQVSTLNVKLLDVRATLKEHEESPIPSPCADAPSPIPSDDDVTILDSQNKAESFPSFLNSGNNIASMAQDIFKENDNADDSPKEVVALEIPERQNSREDDRRHHNTPKPPKESPPRIYKDPFLETRIPDGNDKKPMNAKELFDTYTKSYNSKPATSYVPDSPFHREEVDPFGRDRTSPYRSDAPPPRASEFTESIPLPPPFQQLPPLWPPPSWDQPPPPPPPPPPMPPPTMPPPTQPPFHPPEWNQFEPDSFDELDETDNRNWGEVPGTEELEALSSVQAPLETPKTDPFFPPETSPSPHPYEENRQQHLVSINPKKGSEEGQFPIRCYDYSRLSQEEPPKGKRRDSSDSDMDISDSDSSEAKRAKRNKRGASLGEPPRPRTIIPLTTNASPPLFEDPGEDFVVEGPRNVMDDIDTHSLTEALKHIKKSQLPQSPKMSFTEAICEAENNSFRNEAPHPPLQLENCRRSPLNEFSSLEPLPDPHNGHNSLNSPPPMTGQAWNRGGTPFLQGGPRSRPSFSRRGGFDSPQGGFDSSRGGFDSSRGAFDSTRGGFDSTRGGGFDSPRGGGGFDKPRRGMFWRPRGFDRSWGGRGPRRGPPFRRPPRY